MNTYITLGKVTVSFRDENGTLCSIRRADHYQRQKPKAWGENDFYLVTHERGEIYANFSGEGTVEVNGESFGALPNKLPLKKATNKVIVNSNGKSYTLSVHMVLCTSEEEAESRSKGITYNEEDELWEFDALGFFENLFWLFSDAYRQDYSAEFSIEGQREEQDQPLEQEAEAVDQNDLSLQGQAETSEPPAAESVQDTTPAYTAPEPVFTPEPTHHYSPPAETHHYSAPEPSHYSSYDHSSHSDHSSSSSYDSGSSSSYDSGSSSCDSGGCGCGGGGGD